MFFKPFLHIYQTSIHFLHPDLSILEFVVRILVVEKK
jgi:hypothetical protein